MPDFIKLTELLSHVINSLSLTLLMSDNLKAQCTPWKDWQNSRFPVDAVAFPSCQQSKINILSCKLKLSCPAVPNKQTWAFSDTYHDACVGIKQQQDFQNKVRQLWDQTTHTHTHGFLLYLCNAVFMHSHVKCIWNQNTIFTWRLQTVIEMRVVLKYARPPQRNCSALIQPQTKQDSSVVQK